MNRAAPVKPEFEQDMAARNRKGMAWHVIFQASTVFGIVALIVMLLNIVNGALGYVAYEGKIDPATLAQNGVPIEQQSKEQLIVLLKSKLSSGAYNKLNNEKPMEGRTQAELEQLVLERIVRLQVVDNWNLWISLTQADEIKATVAQ